MDPTKIIKVIQINLNHCKASTALCAKYMSENNISIGLLQDPYISNGRLFGFPNSWSKKSSTNMEAWIVVSKKFPINFLISTTSAVFVNIMFNSGNSCIVLGSQYVPPRSDIKKEMEEWENLYDKKLPLILGCDLNARSQSWGYSYEDGRGSFLKDFLVSNNLTRANTNNEKTFCTINASGCPDFTLANNKGINLIDCWRVEDGETLSDHRYITYSLSTSPVLMTNLRFKTKYGNHTSFKKFLASFLIELKYELMLCTTCDKLEEITIKFVKETQQLMLSHYRKKRYVLQSQFKWWSQKHAIQRNKIKSLLRRVKKSDSPNNDKYKIMLKKEKSIYKKMILQSKNESWKNFCCNQTKVFGSAFKMVTGKHFTPYETNIFSESN